MVSLLTKAGILAVLVAFFVRQKVLNKPEIPVFHKACVGFVCKDVEGGGVDACSNNAICFNQQPLFHKECQNGKCIFFGGPGPSSCNQDGDCPP